MKKLLLSLFVLISFLTLKAQDQTISFYTSAGAALATSGSLSHNATFGASVGVEGVYSFSENIDAFAQLGFYYFVGNPETDVQSNVTTNAIHIPALVGVKANLSNFIAGVGFGYGSYSYSDVKSISQSGFTYSPLVGYKLEKYEIILNYTSTSANYDNLSYIGLKINYKIF